MTVFRYADLVARFGCGGAFGELGENFARFKDSGLQQSCGHLDQKRMAVYGFDYALYRRALILGVGIKICGE